MLHGKDALLCLALVVLFAVASGPAAAQRTESDRAPAATSVQSRWYTWSGGRDATGLFHIQKTTRAKLPDEIVLDIEFVLEWRGEIISLDLQETCANDQYLTPRRIVSKGQGDDEFGTFEAIIQWPEDGPGILDTTSGNPKRRLRLPPGTVGSLAVFELVQRLPFKEGEAFAFHSLEESELNLKTDQTLTYKGKQPVRVRGEQHELHLFEEARRERVSCQYWLNDEHQLIRVLMDGRKEFLWADDDEARKRMAVLRAKQAPLPEAPSPSDPKPLENAPAMPPQAEPVARWFKAASDNDLALLKSVFSKRMKTILEEKGWEKRLEEDHREFTREHGKYRASDFSYTYEGGATEGKVAVYRKGRKLGGLDVIFEDGAWKVNEN